MTELETLKAIVDDENRPANERAAAAEHILALQGQQPSAPVQEPEPWEQIADDDPGLTQWGFVGGKRIAADSTDVLYFSICPMTLADAREALLASRKRVALFAKVRDESLPMDQRIAAANAIRNEGSFPHLKPEEIVEQVATAMQLLSATEA